MSPTDPQIDAKLSDDPSDQAKEEQTPLFVDAATRVSKPSAFDKWFYSVEDKVGQGTIGIAIFFLVVLVILIVAVVFSPI